MPITSPVLRISGPRMVSTPGKRANGKTGAFTETWRVRQPRRAGRRSASLPPSHAQRGDLGHRHAGGLGDEGHGAAGARVHLQHVERRRSLAKANWTFMSPTTPSSLASATVCRSISAMAVGRQRERRQRAGRIARVDPGLLDVLHHPGHVDVRAVADGVDVDLGRVGEEAVDQHRPARRSRGRPPADRSSNESSSRQTSIARPPST